LLQILGWWANHIGEAINDSLKAHHGRTEFLDFYAEIVNFTSLFGGHELT